MTATTIKVPKRTRDRLHRLAKTEGLTLAQAIDKLIDEAAPRPRPSVGGFSSEQPQRATASRRSNDNGKSEIRNPRFAH